MRKFVITISILILVLCGVVYIQNFFKDYDLEEILPQNPVVFFRVKNLEKHFRDFSSSQLIARISSIDYEKAFPQIGVSEQDMMMLKKTVEVVGSRKNQELFFKFFGKDFVVAVYPEEINSLKPDQVTDIASQIFFVTRLDRGVKFKEFFARQFANQKKKGEIQLTRKEYNNKSYYKLTLQDGAATISYVRFGNWLVFGFGDKAVKRCLTASKIEEQAIKNDPNYALFKSRFLPDASLTGYINLAQIISGVKQQIVKVLLQKGVRKEQIRAQIRENLRDVSGFNSFVVSASLGQQSEAKIGLFFDKLNLSPDIQALYECQPRMNQTLSFIPEEAIIYQWNACNNFDYIWRKFLKDKVLEANPLPQKEGASLTPFEITKGKVLGSLQKEIGLNIEQDVLPLMGDEWGGFLSEVDLSGDLPAPRFALFLKVSDLLKAQALTDELVARQQFFLHEETEYAGYEIDLLKLPNMDHLHPAYMFLNNYLIVTTEVDLLKAALDNKGAKDKTIENDRYFSVVKNGRTHEGNFVFYFNIESAMKKAEEIIDFGDRWILQQDEKREAFRSGQEKYLNDLIDQAQKAEKEQVVLAEEKQKLLDEKERSGYKTISLEGITQEIRRKEKVIEAINEKLKGFRETEKKYVDIIESKDFDLPPKGEKDLKRIKAEIAKKESLKTDLEEEIRKDWVAKNLALKIIEKEQKIREKENEAIVARQKAEEVEQQIEAFAKESRFDKRAHKVLVRDIFKPFIRAMREMKYFASTITMNSDNVETLFFWEIK